MSSSACPACRSLCAALSLAVAGCGCVTREAARSDEALLQAENVERSEPAMRAAAARFGAELLPVRVQPLNLLFCPGGSSERVPQLDIRPGTEDGCITESFADPNLFRFRDLRGNAKLAVRAEPQWSEYPRLARRGNTLLRLDAVVSRRSVGKRTQCECDGGPTIAYADPVFAFVLDDVTTVDLRVLKVNVVEDFVERECKTVLVRADEVPPRARVVTSCGGRVAKR